MFLRNLNEDEDDPVFELWMRMAKSGGRKNTVIYYSSSPDVTIGAFNKKRGIHYIIYHYADREHEVLQQFSGWEKIDRTPDVEWIYNAQDRAR